MTHNEAQPAIMGEEALVEAEARCNAVPEGPYLVAGEHEDLRRLVSDYNDVTILCHVDTEMGSLEVYKSVPNPPRPGMVRADWASIYRSLSRQQAKDVAEFIANAPADVRAVIHTARHYRDLSEPMPCGHPAACMGEEGCGWCADLKRAQQKLIDCLNANTRVLNTWGEHLRERWGGYR